MSSSDGLVHHYYKRIDGDDEYKDKAYREVLNILTRYFVSKGIPMAEVIKAKQIGYHLGKELGIQVERKTRQYVFRASATILEANQHKAIELKEYKAAIMKTASFMANPKKKKRVKKPY